LHKKELRPCRKIQNAGQQGKEHRTTNAGTLLKNLAEGRGGATYHLRRQDKSFINRRLKDPFIAARRGDYTLEAVLDRSTIQKR
jgi:hypothetical protein